MNLDTYARRLMLCAVRAVGVDRRAEVLRALAAHAIGVLVEHEGYLAGAEVGYRLADECVRLGMVGEESAAR